MSTIDIDNHADIDLRSLRALVTVADQGSFRGAALWLALSSLVVAGVVALLAWYNRDRSPRFAEPSDPQSD